MANNVFKFPSGESAPKDQAPQERATPAPGKKAASGFIGFVWFVVALVWPVLRWVLAIDVAFQFLRMVWNWDTPGTHAGWTFVAHFIVLIVLTYFVSVFKPRGVK